MTTVDEFLRDYYRRLFPFDLYYRWLSYGNVIKTRFTNREFAYGLPGDIFVRYRSFADGKDMKEDVVSTCPERIDIGPIYHMQPKHHNTHVMVPRERELCFDIDMSDYDDVRTCCSGAKICDLCWKLMVVAVQVLDRALREDFGFKHILWVFSGRRGIHCWVCDENARNLDSAGRGAVAEYLTLIRGGSEKAKKVVLPDSRPLHPLVSKSLAIIDAHFEEICLRDQRIMETEAQWKAVVGLVGDEKLRAEMAKLVEQQSDSETRWQAMEEVLDASMKKKGSKRASNALKEIKIQYLYPRLDINVTKGFNHLLKSPFCVHPGTKKVCVSFDPKKVASFKPDEVPNLDQLVEERGQVKKEGEENDAPTTKEKEQNKAYKATSLRGPIEVFEDFVRNLEGSWRGKLREMGDQKMDF